METAAGGNASKRVTPRLTGRGSNIGCGVPPSEVRTSRKTCAPAACRSGAGCLRLGPVKFVLFAELRRLSQGDRQNPYLVPRGPRAQATERVSFICAWVFVLPSRCPLQAQLGDKFCSIRCNLCRFLGTPPPSPLSPPLPGPLARFFLVQTRLSQIQTRECFPPAS